VAVDIVDLPELSGDFEIIPSLAVVGRTPVWVNNEKYNPFRFGGRTVSPEAMALTLSQSFNVLHYLDITGIRKGKVEWNTFQAVVDSSKEVWADVGVAFSDSVIDPLMSGAAMGIISTKLIHSIEEIAAAYEMTENIILQIDFDENLIARDPVIKDMTPSSLMKEMSGFGMDTFILNNMGPGEKGPDRNLIIRLLQSLPKDGRLYVGAAELKDLKTLDALGVDGAIISASRIARGYS
jgi:uncharacterized protein related to proFAR isomerase